MTGGTGSFGQSFIRFVLENFNPKKMIVFSRDELKQFKMQQELYSNPKYEDILRFFIGDVRDLQRLERGFNGVDIVIHAAALKQVPALEYNPIEAIQTNIMGTQNVINAAIDQGVKKILLLSTDKCVQPINLYGATKLCAEKLFIASNVYTMGKSAFSIMRYGNVMGSRGSIIETLLTEDERLPITVTHKDMTRFWLTLNQCFALVLNSIKNMTGGEIFVPKAPSLGLIDICDMLAPKREKVFIGARPGEKIHETLITEEEANRTFDLGDYYVILPSLLNLPAYVKYRRKGNALPKGFAYRSDTNKIRLTKQKLAQFVNGYYDSIRSPKHYKA